jgi:integrase
LVRLLGLNATSSQLRSVMDREIDGLVRSGLLSEGSRGQGILSAPHFTSSDESVARAATGRATESNPLGLLAQVMRKHGFWAEIADDVAKLPERHDVGRAIPPDQVRDLLEAVNQSGSPALLPLVVLSLDTGLRASEVRSLRHADLELEWKDEVIAAGWLTVPKSKTETGRGRYVPFTQRVCAVLTIWLARFPSASPETYLFPRHAVFRAGGTAPRMVHVDMTKPMTDWMTSWHRALRIAGLSYRWHDLRHTFVTRLAEDPRVSEETIRSLAGPRLEANARAILAHPYGGEARCARGPRGLGR